MFHFYIVWCFYSKSSLVYGFVLWFLGVKLNEILYFIFNKKRGFNIVRWRQFSICCANRHRFSPRSLHFWTKIDFPFMYFCYCSFVFYNTQKTWILISYFLVCLYIRKKDCAEVIFAVLLRILSLRTIGFSLYFPSNDYLVIQLTISGVIFWEPKFKSSK